MTKKEREELKERINWIKSFDLDDLRDIYANPKLTKKDKILKMYDWILPGAFGKYFDDKKLNEKHLSSFEYFVSQLERRTGNKYELVNLVTNETRREDPDFDSWGDERVYSYYVYGATLLVPQILAEKLKATETQLTQKDIVAFVKRQSTAILLNSKQLEYFSTRDYRKKPIEVDSCREELREKLSKEADSNRVLIDDIIGYIDDDSNRYWNGDREAIKLPSKNVANAVFDTLEYTKKMVLFEQLDKYFGDSKEENQELKEEYLELKK